MEKISAKVTTPETKIPCRSSILLAISRGKAAKQASTQDSNATVTKKYPPKM